MSIDNRELYHIKCKGAREVEEVLEIFKDMGIRWMDGSQADEFIPRRNAGGWCYIYTTSESIVTNEHFLMYEISPTDWNRKDKRVMSADEFIKMFENEIVESDISLTDLIMT